MRRRRLTSKDFFKLAEVLLEAGPKIKYRNPNAWMCHLFTK